MMDPACLTLLGVLGITAAHSQGQTKDRHNNHQRAAHSPQLNNHRAGIKGISSMNKAELVDAVALAADITKASATRAVDAVFDNICAALKKDEQVSLVGFGTFVVRSRAARAGRNPQTGAAIEIKAAKVPGFKPGKALKDAVK